MAKYARKVAEVNALHQQGRLNLDQLNAATAKFRSELDSTGQSGKLTFGGMVDNLKGVALGLAGAAGPLALMKKGLDDIKEAVDKARQATADSRVSIGSLRQLAESDQEFQGLKGKAEALFASGSVRSLDEGAGAVFALKSAGLLDEQSFSLFNRLGAKGIIGDIPGVARSVTQFSTAFGAKEAGTAQQILQKAFAAAKFSPASVEQLLATQPRVGAIAAAQGLTDEETFALTSVLSSSVGAEQAATLSTQFLAASGKLKGFDNLDITERVEKLKALHLSQPDLQKKLGSVEAATGFALASSNLDTIKSAEQSLIRANNDPGAINRQLGFADPESDASLTNQQVQNRSVLRNRRAGAFEDLRSGFYEQQRQDLRDFAAQGTLQRLLAAIPLGLSHVEQTASEFAVSGETFSNNARGALNANQQGVLDALTGNPLGGICGRSSWRCVGLIGKVSAKLPSFEMPKVPKGMKGQPITGEEFERMAAAIPKAIRARPTTDSSDPVSLWRFYLQGLWWSGLRLAESLQLRWDDAPGALVADFTGRRPMLRIPAESEKGNTHRLLTMAPEFAQLLQGVPQARRRGYVFTFPAECPRTIHSICQRVVKMGGCRGRGQAA